MIAKAVAKHLFLEDLKGMHEEEIKAHIGQYYYTEGINDAYNYNDNTYINSSEKHKINLRKELELFDIIVAYESVGNWGCDSTSWFLLRNKETNEYFENSGGHDSCYGFEGQWDIQHCPLEYLKNARFRLSLGGYDVTYGDAENNETKTKEFLKTL